MQIDADPHRLMDRAEQIFQQEKQDRAVKRQDLNRLASRYAKGLARSKPSTSNDEGNTHVTLYNARYEITYFGTGDGEGNFTFQSLFWSPGYDSLVPEDLNGDGKADIVLYNSVMGEILVA